ncbi:TPA: hypothetical protein N0F65_005887, partial [Lagenidium giganteum]
QDQQAPLVEFQSGLLLCSIVEKVEHLRPLPGLFRDSDRDMTRPKALHNLFKALQILQKKKTMPLHLLRHHQQMYDGNRSVILHLLHLLLQIRKAYGHHLMKQRCPHRVNNSTNPSAPQPASACVGHAE